MAPEVVLEKFQGPLDLLLQLIEQEKLSINEVSLSHVTEQFFVHLNSLEERRPEDLADFLVIATRLVYVKSRQILPYLYPPDADEGPSLADQLKLYKRYADASLVVEKMWNKGQVAYGRIEPPPVRTGFNPPGNAMVNDLKNAFVFLLRRLQPAPSLPQVAIDHSVSVKHVVESLYAKLRNLDQLRFRDIMASAVSKTEIIVSFLAILDLLKQQKVSIQQSGAFDDFVIERT